MTFLQTVASVSVALVLLGACDTKKKSSDDDDGAGGTTTTSSVATSGAGGAGGSSDCPTNGTTCSDVFQTCGDGNACCICADISCAVIWECVDPSQNDQACPATAPTAGTPCDPMVPACSYCNGELPQLMTCLTGGTWAEGAINGCL